MRLVSGLWVLLLASGCSAHDATEPSSAAVGDYALHIGDVARLGTTPTPLTVRFERVVSDSRCPKGVECVWEGDAVAEVAIARGAERALVQLHTSPKASGAATAHGYRVVLVSLTPAPRSGEPIRPEDYVLALTIKPDKTAAGS